MNTTLEHFRDGGWAFQVVEASVDRRDRQPAGRLSSGG
jgi:hypothetical protein